MSSVTNSGNLKFVAYVAITILSVLSLSDLLSCAEVDEMGDVEWSFVVYSDNRGSNLTHRAALTSIAKIKPDVILNLGDIVFRLEKAFEIKIPREELFPAENLMNNSEFVQNGKLTEKGIAELKEKMPHTDITEFLNDPDINKLADLFTVNAIVNYVEGKLNAA